MNKILGYIAVLPTGEVLTGTFGHAILFTTKAAAVSYAASIHREVSHVLPVVRLEK